MRAKKRAEYICWSNVDVEWGWHQDEISTVIDLWNQGSDPLEISCAVHRPLIEVWLLLANLIWSNAIELKNQTFSLPYQYRPKSQLILEG